MKMMIYRIVFSSGLFQKIAKFATLSNDVRS